MDGSETMSRNDPHLSGAERPRMRSSGQSSRRTVRMRREKRIKRIVRWTLVGVGFVVVSVLGLFGISKLNEHRDEPKRVSEMTIDEFRSMLRTINREESEYLIRHLNPERSSIVAEQQRPPSQNVNRLHQFLQDHPELIHNLQQ